MTNPVSPRDPDAILAAWVEEGPNQLPETTRRAIGVGLRSTRQTRRVLDVPWRPSMNPFARLAVAAAAIVIVVGGAIVFLRPGTQSVGGQSPSSPNAPTSSPAADPSTSPVGAPSIPGGPFTSPRYDFSVERPAGIQVALSEVDWELDSLASPDSKFLDRFTGTFTDPNSPSGTYAFAGIASQALPEGVTASAWTDGHIVRNNEMYGDRCGGRPEDWASVTVAGVDARQVQTDCGSGPASVTEIVFVVRDRGWIITGDTPLVQALLVSLRLPN